jgi:hypothetical protein
MDEVLSKGKKLEEWIELTWPNEDVTLQKESILGAERPKPSKKRGIARIKRRV